MAPQAQLHKLIQFARRFFLGGWRARGWRGSAKAACRVPASSLSLITWPNCDKDTPGMCCSINLNAVAGRCFLMLIIRSMSKWIGGLFEHFVASLPFFLELLWSLSHSFPGKLPPTPCWCSVHRVPKFLGFSHTRAGLLSAGSPTLQSTVRPLQSRFSPKPSLA